MAAREPRIVFWVAPTTCCRGAAGARGHFTDAVFTKPRGVFVILALPRNADNKLSVPLDGPPRCRQPIRTMRVTFRALLRLDR